MGDIADYTLDCIDYDNLDGNSEEYLQIPIKCKHCHKKVFWESIQNKWTLVNNDGNVHTCKGYSPPIEVLKYLYKNKRK